MGVVGVGGGLEGVVGGGGEICNEGNRVFIRHKTYSCIAYEYTHQRVRQILVRTDLTLTILLYVHRIEVAY